MRDPEDLSATLTTLPDWDTLNAYEMTKRCCAELTKRGQRLPSWTSIREIIGKGSANDINRGKEDFRREHGDGLRKMSGFVKGVPDALAPHILGVWTAAISLVREEFNGQVADWQAQIERAEAAVAHAETERDQATSRAAALQGQNAGLQEAIASLQGRVDTERAAREQAERMFESNRHELAGQRDELRAALVHSQQELSAAITRLEGVEKHALMEIARARTDAQDRIASVEARAKRESGDLSMEIARVSGQLHDLRAQLASATQQTASMRERLQRAEEQADHLASENARLVAALQGAVTGARPALRGKYASIKKRRTGRRGID